MKLHAQVTIILSITLACMPSISFASEQANRWNMATNMLKKAVPIVVITTWTTTMSMGIGHEVGAAGARRAIDRTRATSPIDEKQVKLKIENGIFYGKCVGGFVGVATGLGLYVGLSAIAKKIGLA